MSKFQFTPEQKASIAQEYLDGAGSSIELARKYKVDNYTIRRWAHRYEERGILAFLKKNGNAQYTAKFKISCVELYLQGKMSMEEIVVKYNISSDSVLQNWILRYNANRELKDYNPKKGVYMAEARRETTIEERKEIVKYCLEHNRNYKETASLYNVSYGQVYSWIKKYDTNGENGLADKRGHRKKDDEVDELEKLRRENIRLKRQLEEKDMVVELLKKVKELERK